MHKRAVGNGIMLWVLRVLSISKTTVLLELLCFVFSWQSKGGACSYSGVAHGSWVVKVVPLAPVRASPARWLFCAHTLCFLLIYRFLLPALFLPVFVANLCFQYNLLTKKCCSVLKTVSGKRFEVQTMAKLLTGSAAASLSPLSSSCLQSSLEVLECKEAGEWMDSKPFRDSAGSKEIEDNFGILHSLTRKELREYLNTETGLDKKYTSYSKCMLIDRIRSILLPDEVTIETTKSNITNSGNKPMKPSPEQKALKPNVGGSRKQQKKSKQQSASPANSVSFDEHKSDSYKVCNNSACRAKVHHRDPFCKRCSCCICHNFDDNKDPSLWIVCGEDLPESGVCEISCHIECALKRQVAGTIHREDKELEGSYYCTTCRRITSLIGCWKKQLLHGKNARRVDVLCQRLTLAKGLLKGTQQYKEMHEIVLKAVQKLEDEIGPIDGTSSRGIVNRLSCGGEVQKLIQDALDAFKVASESQKGVSTPGNPVVRIKEIFSSSVLIEIADMRLCGDVLGFKLWHRKASEPLFIKTPTCTLPASRKEALICHLDESTDYIFKVVAFSSDGDKWQYEISCGTKHSNSKDISGMPLADMTSHSENSINPSVAVKEEPADSQVGDTDAKEDLFYSSVQEKMDASPVETASTDNRLIIEISNLPLQVDGGVVDFDAENSCANSHDVKTSNQAYDPERMPKQEPGEKEKYNPEKLDASHLHLENDKRQSLVHQIRLLESQAVSSSLPPKNDGKEIVPFVANRLTPVVEPSSCVIEELGSQADDISNGIIEHFYNKVVQIDSQVNPSRKRGPQAGINSLNLKLNGKNGAASHSLQEKLLEYCVKVVRWLEMEGHLKSEFRVRFVTWFALRATEDEKRVVSIFIKNMGDNPERLAGQLKDTFEEIISVTRRKVTLNS